MNTIEEWLGQPDGLATQLNQLRRTAGLTGHQLATQLRWTQSKVSKLETGKQMPTSEDLDAWATTCGADPAATATLHAALAEAQALHREWKHRTRLGQVAIQRSHADLARTATSIRNIEVSAIPGLLQTAEYARYRMLETAAMHGADPTEIDAAVTERIRRQDMLYDRTKTFEFIITETVLRLLLCPPAVMLGQLDRLNTLTFTTPNVSFGIIPFGVELPTTPQHGFILYDDLAVVETFATETIHTGTEAAAYTAAMNRLLAETATGENARRIILDAAQALKVTCTTG